MFRTHVAFSNNSAIAGQGFQLLVRRVAAAQVQDIVLSANFVATFYGDNSIGIVAFVDNVAEPGQESRIQDDELQTRFGRSPARVIHAFLLWDRNHSFIGINY